MEPHLRLQLARIDALLCENNGDELLINGPRGAFVTGRSGTSQCPSPFAETESAAEFARELAWGLGLRLDPYHPSAGGSISDFQMRWHAVINPVAQDEVILSVRKHRFDELSLDNFFIPSHFLSMIARSVHERRPLLIAGATGAGKTTFLVSILKEYFLQSRVVIIESLSEISAHSPSWIRLNEVPPSVSGKGGFSLSQVGRECLRLRPDVFTVGEIRGDEARIFYDVSQTGHGGALTTIHAGSVEQAMRRVVHLANLNHSDIFAPLVILLERDHKGSCVVDARIVSRQELS